MNQRQRSGDSSLNIQGQTIIFNAGISAERAHEIALDVYRANALELSSVAQDVAYERATALVDDFINAVIRKNPSLLNALKDPDVQYGLFNAQKDFARKGTEELRRTLVDLLTERCGAETRSLRAIVLDEALETVGKLTVEQVAALTIAWLILKVVSTDISSRQDLLAWIEQNFGSLLDSVPTHDASYEHLAYAGCATISDAELMVGGAFGQRYPGLFCYGFSEKDIPEHLRNLSGDSSIFVSCMSNPERLQVNAITVEAAKELALARDLDVKSLVELHSNKTLGPANIDKWLKDSGALPARLVEAYRTTGLRHIFQLTSVGTAIAHSNWQRVTGSSTELEVWIPDA